MSIQVAILRWGLRPLHQVADDLKSIQMGDKSALEGEYPSELSELTGGLNDLLINERAMQTRYRHSLGDLAHSLKTPLAVLQGEVEQCKESPQLVDALTDQVERMNRIVKYQLQRAVSSSGGALSAALPIEPITAKIVNSLQKVYRDKSIEAVVSLDETAMFHGEEGDLYEIVGNLSDNAFKWCDHKVSVEVVRVEGRRGRDAAEITIEDDGPGVPDAQKMQILKRGVRADEQTPGWGIGLSIVMEIIDGYGGAVVVKDSALGGAKFEVRLP
ncbi:MAG: GHKL domain-containing protein [Methylococcales bacterium]|nr:GHKL domain-containing protein [Methylococcales bacterium]